MSTLCEETIQAQDVPDLIPARMLNEFTYCPRLAYLEWVQGEFTDNLETLEGRFGHRRVDHPDRSQFPDQTAGSGGQGSAVRVGVDGDADEPPVADAPNASGAPETIHARSVTLSAPREGLIAKMDLIDLQAGVALPVDYKRGRVPDAPGGAWEPERVQLCAQGLVLRENGYLCEGGILYFIESRRRVSIPFDDELVERTRQLLRQMREMAAARTMPPPLIDSPKCPRCSLVGICLPDETFLLKEQDVLRRPSNDEPIPNLQSLEGSGVGVQGSGTSNGDPIPSVERTKPEVRRLIPARDDALPLYVKEQGVTLGKSGEVLTVKRRDEVLQKVKLKDVSQISLLGAVQVTAQALREIVTSGVPICHFTYGGWFYGMTTGMMHKNVELRIAQFRIAADKEESLRFAKRIVSGKIKNCRTILRRHVDDDAKGLLRRLEDLVAKAEKTEEMGSLLGIEGMAANIYFEGFATLLPRDAGFDFESRNRRPPRDPVNALMSLVYSLLTKDLTVTLHAVGFDPMLGFYHQPRYGRPSLALDLIEEFRPIVADSVVLTLINNGEVSADSFLRRGGGVVLTDAGRRAVMSAYERRMDTLVTHPIFGYRISYRRVLEVQSRLLARAVIGELSEYPCFSTR